MAYPYYNAPPAVQPGAYYPGSALYSQPAQPYSMQPAPDQLAQLRQPYQTMQSPQPAPQMQQSGGQSMVWVSGEQEAASYLVAPNSAVALWDSNAPTIYLKQADASGKPSLKIFDLVERTSAARSAQTPQGVEFATKADLDALAARVEALSTREAAPAKAARKTTAKEDMSNE